MTDATWTPQLEESTSHHWIGWAHDVVLLFAYEGSHDDPRHVHTGARLVERLASERGAAKLLFVVPPLHSKPPDALVRRAIVQAAPRFDGRLSKASVVVAGTGFSAAAHRGAVTGVLALLRPGIPVKVHASIGDGLAFLIGGDHAALPALARACEERASTRAP